MAAEREFTVRMKITSTGLEVLDNTGTKIGEIERKTHDFGEAGARSFDIYQKAALAITGALTTAAGAVIYMTGRALEQQDTLNKLAQSVGISTRELSAMRVVAELGNVQMAEFGQTMGLFSKQIVSASDATSQSARIFAALGVSAREPLPALMQVADAFKTLPDGAEKTNAALALFGRAGKDLIPILNQGSEGIRQLQEEAEALGVTFDEETGRRAEEFNDNIRRLHLAVE